MRVFRWESAEAVPTPRRSTLTSGDVKAVWGVCLRRRGSIHLSLSHHIIRIIIVVIKIHSSLLAFPLLPPASPSYSPHASISRIRQAICARRAASASRLWLARRGRASLWWRGGGEGERDVLVVEAVVVVVGRVEERV